MKTDTVRSAPALYSPAWKADYIVGKLGLISAFGDTIGTQVNKAELALCAKYAAQVRDALGAHDALVRVATMAQAYMEGRKFGHGIEDPLWHEAKAALELAKGGAS